MAATAVSFGSSPPTSSSATDPDGGGGSPTPTASPPDGTGWKWWSSIRIGGGNHAVPSIPKSQHQHHHPKSALTESTSGSERLGASTTGTGTGGDPRRRASKVSLSHFFGGGAGGQVDEQKEKADEAADPADQAETASEVDVDNLLWEAQLAFVNHRPGHAINLLEQAAKLGSSHACLNLANVSLRQQTSNANEKKSSSHIHLAGQQPAIQTQHDLRKGVGWLLQGLRIELAKPSSDSPTAGDTYDSSGFEDEPLQLEVVNDLAQSLTSLYRYGKLKPPQSHQQSSTSGPGKHDTSDLWIEGADLAAELVQHPSIKVDVGHDAPTGYFDAFRPTANRCEVGSPTDFKDPKCRDARCVHLDPPARLRRSCNVHLFYLLALSRFPFHSPPSTPSLSAPSTPIATVPYASPLGSSTGSGGHHWGHAEAQKYWSLIIHVSRLPGGVGTREGEAIVVKAQRRLGLLDDAAAREVVEPVTPSGAVELPHGHVLAHHQSPESVEGAFLQSPTVSAVTQQPLHQNGSSSRPVKLRNDSSSSSGGQSRSKKEATTPLGLSPAQELAEEVKAMDAKRSSSSRSTTPVPSASGSKHAFPTASTPTSDDTVHHPTLDRLRGRHKSRPRLRSTLSRDIFLGDRDRTYSAPAVPSLSSLSASAGPSSLSRHLTPTTFLSIEHAGLHDSKGKHVPGREGLLSQPSMQHLAGDGRSTFSRRLRNDSFASLASLDAPSVFSTTSAFPSTTAPGTTTSFRQRAGSTVSSIRSWRPSLPQAFAPRAAVTSTNRPAIQVLERALKRDADARMGWTWAETEMDPDEEEALESSAATTVDGGEGADDTRDWGTADGGLQESPRTQQSEEPASDSTLASSGSTAPTSIPASGSTSRTSPDRPTPPVAESPSSKKGKIFVPVTKPHNRQPLTAPGTPRASRERRAIDRRLQSASYSSKLGNPTSSTHLSPLASGGDKSGSTSGTSGSDEDGPPRTLKSKMSMDPLLAALEEQSRVNVKAKCAVCRKTGINFPKCPKCDKTFCSRQCRVSAEGGGDGQRHVCRSLTASPTSISTATLPSPPSTASTATAR